MLGDAETILCMMRLVYAFTPTNAEYMQRASDALQAQGRGALDTTNAKNFLEGLAAHGIVLIRDVL
jgi:hypothetical protein